MSLRKCLPALILPLLLAAWGNGDYQDIKEIKASLASIEKQLDHNRSEIEKDLILRRAKVDHEVTVLTLGVAALERRSAMCESRHNRLRDQFYQFTGALSPVLKDMDVDLTRLWGAGKAMASTAEEPSDDGRSNGNNGDH